jgi:hypothetical protein
MDQDLQSIQCAHAAYGGLGVEFHVSGLKPILSAKFQRSNGQFDFIYAASLFDYLDDPLARLLSRLPSTCSDPVESCGCPTLCPAFPTAVLWSASWTGG